MCFCLFPRFKTVLHRVLDKEVLLQAIFKQAESKVPEVKVNGYELPFFFDFDGKTPVHDAVRSGNVKALSILLSNLKDYSIDHHDRMICDVLPAIVRMEVSVLSSYFEARVQPLKSLSVP